MAEKSPYTPEELEVCRQMGTDPVEVYGERKAMSDTEDTQTQAPEIILPFAAVKDGPDLDGDGYVNIYDAAVFIDQYLQSGPRLADFSQDQNVNLTDLATLFEYWYTQAAWLHD